MTPSWSQIILVRNGEIEVLFDCHNQLNRIQAHREFYPLGGGKAGSCTSNFRVIGRIPPSKLGPIAMYNAPMPSAPLDRMHDATLISIQLDWESGTCIARFGGAPNLTGGPFLLRWSAVSDLHVPRTLEWGPSISVLSAVENPRGHYALTLQSGDVITILADSVTLEQ